MEKEAGPMHLFYVPLSEKEKRFGLLWLAVLALSSALIPLRSSALSEFLFHALHFGAAVLIFHRFLKSSLEVPHTGPFRILRIALLGLILAQLANLLTNDLLFYFFPKYFYYNETGPHFANVRKALIESFAAENAFLTGVAIILFVPIAEELFHRGLVFGGIARKNLALAYVISITLYTLLPVIPLFGNYPGD